MSDGVVLTGAITRPATASGTLAPGRFPVVVTFGSYTPGTAAVVAAGSDPTYLVKRGYVQVNVDTRGTGSSGGHWCALCRREQRDGYEVISWIRRQAWSNGASAITGTSYSAINQLLTAAERPPGLKALFPIVPSADVYRDVVGTGGAFDVSFISIWATLMLQSQIVPSSSSPVGRDSLPNLVEHLVAGVAGFTIPWFAGALSGDELAYDGPFYAERSPIDVAGRIDVPTFLIGGERDIFQRGTPLLFENLVRRGVPTRFIQGPWNHSQAATSSYVDDAGYGSIGELQLRWFDHYVKGLPDPRLNSDIPALTYYEMGTGAWRHGSGWMQNRRGLSFKLSGTSSADGTPGGLTASVPSPGSSTTLPVPLAGVCTRSTDQWTAGLLGAALPARCLDDQATNDKAGVVFETAPMKRRLAFQGPMNAHLFVSSSSGDGLFSVSVEDVAPDGTVSRLSAGWQMISRGALDTSRSRYLDGRLIQAYHPFTRASSRRLRPGVIAPVDVEIFPTDAAIVPGHRLRVAIQSFDTPHLLPVLPDLAAALGVVTIHTSPSQPSMLTLPALG